jgi:transglutaminase-like putative cysteine protease
MRSFFVVAAIGAVMFCGAGASATPGDVSGELHLGFQHPTGVTWDGRYFWAADRKTDLFYKIDPANGETIHSMESPGYFPSGLAWDGKYLWSTDPTEGKIFATDVSTGKTLRTLDAPSPSPMGIAWDGQFLWLCDNRIDRISKIDPLDGTTIVSFPSPAGDPRGLTFDGAYLWCSDRMRDEIHMIDPTNGMVVMTFDAPGPFCWGLAWKEDKLVNIDYQEDALFEIIVRDGIKYRTYSPRSASVDFTTEAIILGNGQIESLDIYYAVPSDRPNQKLMGEVVLDPSPMSTEFDRWGQKIALFRFEDLAPPQSVEVTMKANLETSSIRYYIFPDEVGTKIPGDIAESYLADDIKYDINNPYIQDLVKKVAGGEKNLYWRARKLYQHLIENMVYELAGGWNTAPTVLARGNGSCSEYSFSYIALCRAAGIPARYVGSLVVRGDDASYDDVFHRWNEIYLPNYGWVPVDANAGDRTLPADQAAAFGGISNRFLVTTEGGGGSEYLAWSYNHENTWVSTGKCTVRFEAIAEWEPLEEE